MNTSPYSRAIRSLYHEAARFSPNGIVVGMDDDNLRAFAASEKVHLVSYIFTVSRATIVQDVLTMAEKEPD